MAIDGMQLHERALGLADTRGGRVLIAIVGAPGAGKSTIAENLVDRLGPRGALVPMDGFHLSQRQLERLGRAERKGAPDTFDADGLAHLLARIRDSRVRDVYAPEFDREIEEPIAAGLVVPAGSDIVLVEGNYLLLDEGPWRAMRALFDEAWFIRIPDAERSARLVRRHEQFGRSNGAAKAWVEAVDEPNARLVESSAARADLIVQQS